MTNADRYKLCTKTHGVFCGKRYYPDCCVKNMEIKDGNIFIYWTNEQLPSVIANSEGIQKFNELKEKYGNSNSIDFYRDFLNSCISLLEKQMDEYKDDAIKEASINPKIFKIRCLGRSGRSQYDYSTAELYGMYESEIFNMCKETVDRYRSEDCSRWHVLDKDNNILY